MKLTVQKNIENNRYSAIVKFREYGSTTLTPEDEQKIIDDFSPKFKLSDIDFNGKYNLSNKKIILDNESGENVTLNIPNKSIALNDELEIGYTVHLNEIKDDEVGTILNDKNLVAKAKIQLFVDKISECINDLIVKYSDTLDDFEDEEVVEVG